MHLQTKPNEEIKTFNFSQMKKKENYIYQDSHNLSCWNRYLLMYPQKCTLKILKKKYQEKWENAYLRVKNARASRALRWALDPGQYWLALLARLRFATSAKSREKFLGPPPSPNPGSASVVAPQILCSRVGMNSRTALLQQQVLVKAFQHTFLCSQVRMR